MLVQPFECFQEVLHGDILSALVPPDEHLDLVEMADHLVDEPACGVPLRIRLAPGELGVQALDLAGACFVVQQLLVEPLEELVDAFLHAEHALLQGVASGRLRIGGGGGGFGRR